MSRSRSGQPRALVVGAGGYLGGAIVGALSAQGWRVRGFLHSPRGTADVERKGAEAIVGDVLDLEAVNRASRGCTAVVHVAAAGGEGPEGARRAEMVRVQGSRNLLEAARAQGVRRLVVGSGYWVYADQPGTITESSALDPRGESLLNYRAEQVALDPAARGRLEVLVVRPGMVYGDGSWFRPVVDAVRTGTYRYIGDGSNPWSFVSLEDAGAGFARIVESGAPGEVYNLVDGHPATWKEFADLVSDRLGRPHPSSISPAEGTAIYGPDVAHHLQARRACSSAKIERLGWKPRHVDFRTGMAALLSKMIAADSRPS